MIEKLNHELKQELLRKSRVHLLGRREILAHQESNLQEMLTIMTKREKEFWLESDKKIFTADDVRNTQTQENPWGVFCDNDKGWVMTSGGSGGQKKIKWPSDWNRLLRSGIQTSRIFDAVGISRSDVLFTYDTGTMYSGNKMIEAGFSLVLDGHVIQSQVSTIREKLTTCFDFGVTFISGVPRFLEKFARYLKLQNKRMPLRMLISTGYKYTQDQRKLFEDTFECRVGDMYGSVECGNIFWTCPQGRNHVNIDLVKVEKDPAGNTLFTGLNVNPVFNYFSGDRLEIVWPEKPCECGSHLPVCTKLDSQLSLQNYNEKG